VLRLFVDRQIVPGDTVRIAGPDLRHVQVLRLSPGAELRLVDAAGLEHEATLLAVTAREAVARADRAHAPHTESALDLVLAPALLKAPRMDLVIEKATELGVQRIVPVETRHAVARGAHLERWQRIARAAASQSGRTRLPIIEPPQPIARVLGLSWPGLRLLADERERGTRFSDLFQATASVIALIGPEGGLAPDEAAAARAHGFLPVSLGPRILRAETAAIVVAAHCQRQWGDG
jgi:16S rRNA (uracil1498-N3)-methyltransferase